MVQKVLSSQTYGKLTDSYAYNALDQLTEYVGYDGYRQAFTYDANGMRQSKSEAGDANRSTLEELLRGNVAGLPEIVEPAQSQTNADVPAGLEWATTEYLYDLTQEYYQVISETTTYANGTSATTAYAYGLERIAAYHENGVTRYVYDGRGSVAQTVNVPVAGKAVSSNLPDVGVQVQTFSYTAYGEQMGGVKVSGFTYNAEAYDAATGMLNLRARQYEPAVGRFGQKDIVRGKINTPLGLNRYPYCLNSPIQYIDPEGLFLKEIFTTIKSRVDKIISNVTGIIKSTLQKTTVNKHVAAGKRAADSNNRNVMVSTVNELNRTPDALTEASRRVLRDITEKLQSGNSVSTEELSAACQMMFDIESQKIYDSAGSFSYDDALRNPVLSHAQRNLSLITQLKYQGICWEFDLYRIKQYDRDISRAAFEFGVDKNAIQAILFREQICYGLDDVMADTAFELFGRESSTGLGQIKPSTALEAERIVYGKPITSPNEMWYKLQDPVENIRYVAMILKSNESLVQNYSKPVQESHTYEELLLSRYNGTGDSSIEYGEVTYQYYLAFKELENSNEKED